MEKYIEMGHGIGTILLLLIYGVLAILLFRSKNNGLSVINRGLAQLAQLTLLAVYLSGLFLSITLGRLVHSAHHILSALPIIALFSIRFLPASLQPENKNRLYAWLFAALFLFTLIAGISSHFSILPKL